MISDEEHANEVPEAILEIGFLLLAFIIMRKLFSTPEFFQRSRFDVLGGKVAFHRNS